MLLFFAKNSAYFIQDAAKSYKKHIFYRFEYIPVKRKTGMFCLLSFTLNEI